LNKKSKFFFQIFGQRNPTAVQFAKTVLKIDLEQFFLELTCFLFFLSFKYNSRVVDIFYYNLSINFSIKNRIIFKKNFQAKFSIKGFQK
jgi:hypothetical protein